MYLMAQCLRNGEVERKLKQGDVGQLLTIRGSAMPPSLRGRLVQGTKLQGCSSL